MSGRQEESEGKIKLECIGYRRVLGILEPGFTGGKKTGRWWQGSKKRAEQFPGDSARQSPSGADKPDGNSGRKETTDSKN